MAFSVGQLSAAITADMKGFNTAMRQVRRKGTAAANSITKKFEQMGPKMERIGRGLTLGLTLPIAGIGAALIKTASDAEETQQKFDVVFKDISKAATQTSKDLQESFGLSSKAANQLLGDVGDILTGFGFTQETALGLSKQVNELAVDLASFTNFAGGAEGASRALTKALLGEAESVKALGIVIRQDTEEYKDLVAQIQRAKDVGLVQAKALAALEIATEQSKNAIGDFARTQESFANQMRQLKEEVTDLAISFGKQLIPAAKSAIGVLRSATKWLTDMSESGKAVTLAIGGIAAIVGPVLTALGFMAGQIKNLIPLVGKMAKGVKALTAAMVANPYLAVAAAIAVIGAKIYFANQRVQEFAKSVKDALSADINTKSYEEINALIAEQTRKVENLKELQKTSGGVAIEALTKEKKLLSDLIDLRDNIALKTLEGNIAKGMLQDALALDGLLKMLSGTVQKVNIKAPFVEAKKPVDDILLALDMMPKKFAELSADEILGDAGNLNLGEKIFPPGSLGAMQEKLTMLREQLQYATDPQIIEGLKEQIGLTQNQIDQLSGSTVQAGNAASYFGNQLGNALSQAVLHAKNLLGVLGNLAKQFASKILMRGLQLLLSGGFSGISGLFGKNSFFSGIFHQGGIVPGSGESLALVRGGEGVFTPGQMKAMGSKGGTKKVQLQISGQFTQSGSELRAVINESRFIDL